MSPTPNKLSDDEAWLNDHAALTGRLFSRPGVTAQLLQGFFGAPLLADLDLSNMKPVQVDLKVNANGPFQRVLIWRVARRDGGDLCLLLLLVLRPTSDRYIALHVFSYVSQLLLWDIGREGRAAQTTVTAVLPIVLYTGKDGWTAPLELGQLMAPSPLSNEQPEQRYYVVDALSYTSEELQNCVGLPALWFRLLGAADRDQMAVVAEAARFWFASHPEFSAVEPIFADILAIMSGKVQAPLDTDKP